jgi:hypothetical protein
VIPCIGIELDMSGFNTDTTIIHSFRVLYESYITVNSVRVKLPLLEFPIIIV